MSFFFKKKKDLARARNIPESEFDSMFHYSLTLIIPKRIIWIFFEH